MLKFGRRKKQSTEPSALKKGVTKVSKTLTHEPFALKAPKKDDAHFLNKRRSLIPNYFRESWRELRRVQWPKRGQAWRLTIAVFIFASLFAALTAAADYGLTKLAERIFLK